MFWNLAQEKLVSMIFLKIPINVDMAYYVEAAVPDIATEVAPDLAMGVARGIVLDRPAKDTLYQGINPDYLKHSPIPDPLFLHTACCKLHFYALKPSEQPPHYQSFL
jgi:hypothetical protein